MIANYSLSVLVSAALLVSVSMVLVSCTTCWKKIRGKKDKKKLSDEQDVEKGKQNDKNNDQKENGVKTENGIANTAFENAAECENVETCDTQVQGNASKPESLSEVAVEEAKTGGDANGVADAISEDKKPRENSKEENSSLKEKTAENSSKQDQTAGAVHPDDTEDSAEATSCSDVTNVMSDVILRSTSIHRNDVQCLSSVLEDVAIHPTIPEEAQAHASAAGADGEKCEENVASSEFDNFVIEGGWRRKVKLSDLLTVGLIDRNEAQKIAAEISEQNAANSEQPVAIPDSLKPFLCGGSPVAGILLSEVGEKKSIFSAAKDGILRRGMAISLLEAQAATGNIIDPITGRKISVTDAFQLGLFDKVYETVVSRAERAVTGYKSRISDDVLSLGQAISRGLVIESHGIRLLEVQLATGGIIDHKTNLRLPLEVAVKQGLLDKQHADVVKEACSELPNESKPDNLKTFFDPNTEENVTYSELLKRSVVDTETGIRLFPLEKIRARRLNCGNHSGRSSLASSRASSKESIPSAVAASP